MALVEVTNVSSAGVQSSAGNFVLGPGESKIMQSLPAQVQAMVVAGLVTISIIDVTGLDGDDELRAKYNAFLADLDGSPDLTKDTFVTEFGV